MAKYRIRVEALDPAEELRAEYRMGIECDGFTVLTHEDLDENGVNTTVSIHHMSNYDIAEAMCHDVNTITAAFMAKAQIDADYFRQKYTMRKLMKKLNGIRDDENHGDDE